MPQSPTNGMPPPPNSHSPGMYSQYYPYAGASPGTTSPAAATLSHTNLASYPSPSSQDSASVSSPQTDMYSQNGASSTNVNGKRSASTSEGRAAGRKKARKDDTDGDVGASSSTPRLDGVDPPPKPKTTRGSRACTTCRRLKMKCVGAEQGPPCKRCSTGGHECIFEESNRGKRSSKKHEILTRSLRKMERTLDTVLRSIGNPSVASAMMSRSPSPVLNEAPHDPDVDRTSHILGSRGPSPPPSAPLHANHRPPPSPKLHSLPDNSLNPLGLLAEASLANRRSSGSSMNPAGFVARDAAPQGGDASGSRRLGVASANYFKPGPMTILPLRRLYIERQVQPEMLTFTSKEQVMRLFNIYYDHINIHCTLLERDFHTPALVCSRSPFLLTTICAIASRFLPPEDNIASSPGPDGSTNLHVKLTDLAKKLAYSVPAAGYKSVEIVQAYLLLSQWGCGAVERYEQDRTWGLLGMGIRMATDLNLHRKSASSLSRPKSSLPGMTALQQLKHQKQHHISATLSPEQRVAEERQRVKEIHNRERTWVVCFCLDRSFSAQVGKPYSIREDEIIRDVQHWATSPVATPGDLGLAAYVELQRILSRFLDFLYSATGTDSPSASGLLGQCDHLLVIRSFETQLTSWHDAWRLASIQGPGSEYYQPMSQFYFNYAMLVLNSFGLQDSLTRTPMNMPHFFARVYHSAMRCCSVVKDELGPKGFLRYMSDSHFVQISYAVLSLMKLVRPEFQPFLNSEQRIVTIVTEVANLLENTAANPHHTPALYATFLRALITAKFEDAAAGTLPSANTVFSGHHSHHIQVPVEGIQHDPMLSSTSSNGTFGPPSDDTQSFLDQFQFHGEMGPGSHDISTFPPTLLSSSNPQPNSHGHNEFASISGLPGMQADSMNILSSGFWDSVLVPGYSSMDGLSGGFVFGAGGSGLITPKVGATPTHSGRNSPVPPGSLKGMGPAGPTSSPTDVHFSVSVGQHQKGNSHSVSMTD